MEHQPPETWSEADQPGDALEQEMSDMDAPYELDAPTTASEQRRGHTLEEALAAELPDRPERERTVDEVLFERDEPDHEPELLGEEAPAEDPLAPEEAAMHEED